MSRFWIFMLIVDILIPCTMLGFGLYFFRGKAKTRKAAFGYRSSYAMKSEESWKFAQRHAGKVWLLIGGAEFLVSVGTLLLLRHSSNGWIGAAGIAFVLLQLAGFFLAFLPTERALRRKFGKKAGRKKKK